MENRIGRAPVLLTFWQHLGTWVDRNTPKQGLAAHIFFTAGAIFGTLLCFGFRPVLVGLRDWLHWRLARRRTKSAAETVRTLAAAEEWICAGDDGVVIIPRTWTP